MGESDSGGQQRDAGVVIFATFERDFSAKLRPQSRMSLGIACDGRMELYESPSFRVQT